MSRGQRRGDPRRHDDAPGTYRLATNVRPVGVFHKRYRTRVREALQNRSLASLRTERHRTGWPWVVAALGERADVKGILIDDFVERTFHPHGWGEPSLRERLAGVEAAPITWREPWIGIFHHPPNLPEWLQEDANPRTIFRQERFQESLPYLRGAVALSHYLADWLRTELGVPVAAVKHPTEFPERKFQWRAFVENPRRSLVQIGWYLRNYRAIYQVEVPQGFRKVHLAQNQWFVEQAQRHTDRSSPFRHRPDLGEVQVVPWLPPEEYDGLFTSNVAFLELFDASANNVVVEAIARHTPLVVNRHPAVEEYLGAGYPLYYNDITEVPALLELPRLRDAHEYLRMVDTRDLELSNFVEHVRQFAEQVHVGVHDAAS